MDGRKFDGFSRSLATSVSRRRVLGGLLGAAIADRLGVAKVLGAPKNPSTGKPSQRSITCPGASLSPPCSNLIDTGGNFDADACQAAGNSVVQLQLPTHNGLCDVPIINDIDQLEGFRDRYGKASFEDACLAHDCCYATCGSSQEQCDGDLYLAMEAACTGAYPVNLVQRQLCINTATTYYYPVQSPANTSWRDQ